MSISEPQVTINISPSPSGSGIISETPPGPPEGQLLHLYTPGNMVQNITAGSVSVFRNNNGNTVSYRGPTGFLTDEVADNIPAGEDDNGWWFLGPQASQYMPNSEDFSAWTPVQSIVGAPSAQSPYEATDTRATPWTDDGINGEHRLSEIISFPNPSQSRSVIGSIFVQRITGQDDRNIRLALLSNPAAGFPINALAMFDLSDGSVQSQGAGLGAEPFIEAHANGWYRIGIIMHSPVVNAAHDIEFQFVLADGSFNLSYQGDSLSGLNIFGCNLNYAYAFDGLGFGWHNYIPTAGTTPLTITPENHSIPSLGNIPSWEQPFTVFTRYRSRPGSWCFGGNTFFFATNGGGSKEAVMAIGDDGNLISVAVGNMAFAQGDFDVAFDSPIDGGPAGTEGSVAMVSDGVNVTFYLNGIAVGAPVAWNLTAELMTDIITNNFTLAGGEWKDFQTFDIALGASLILDLHNNPS